jgi:hypothetical protein
VLVDGPPAITGKCARYPAMPIVLQYLARHRLDVVVDDYRRRDEFEIVDRWARLIEDRQIEFERVELDFEKGACLLRLA